MQYRRMSETSVFFVIAFWVLLGLAATDPIVMPLIGWIAGKF